jgi:hypothetical protein
MAEHAAYRKACCRAFKAGHNIVLLDPEVAHAFPSEEAVNEALKSLIKVARDSVN